MLSANLRISCCEWFSTYNISCSESTESGNVEEAEDDGAKQMTLEEWKKQEEQKRLKSQFKLRKANEGVDTSQWKGAQVYKKKTSNDSDEEEEETDDDEEDVSIGPWLLLAIFHRNCLEKNTFG